MTEGQAPQSIFTEEVAMLNEIRQALANKIQASGSGGKLPASVAHAAGVMFQYFDTAYLWMTQAEQFIHMHSQENVDKVANEAMAKGNLSVVDGGAQ